MSINVKYDKITNSDQETFDVDTQERGLKTIWKSIKESKRGKMFLYLFAFFLLGIGIYSLSIPFLPQIQWMLTANQKYDLPYSVSQDVLDKLQDKVTLPTTEATTEKVIPKENRVVLPTIKVDMAIIEAATEEGLTYGAWRIPAGGTPGYNNFILTCHRLGFGFLPEDIMKSSSCYNLDKLNIGDPIIVYWNGKEYDYTVTAEERVTPDQTRIEVPTEEHKLTMYTCDPIGVNTYRLVKYAKLNSELNPTTTTQN